MSLAAEPINDTAERDRNEHHALSVRDAKKSYAGKVALNGVSFHLKAGEHLALLGPNGAGKTTLIRCISGRVKAESGNFELLGKALTDKNRHSLGIVPQEIALYPKLTARENLEVFGRLYGVSQQKIRERVRWALQWTDLTDRANDLSSTFSGGMKRRLNIAAGILHRPTVILLDEPTVGVDPQSRERIFEMLEELRNDGASLLLTTHQLEDAEAHCDRIVIIDSGSVIANGTRNQLIESTIGSKRQMSVRVDRVPKDPIPGFELNNNSMRLETVLDDVAKDMPPLLNSLAASGYVVEDVDIRAPSLQNVFLKLTGRELRE